MVGAEPRNIEASIRAIERAAGALATASVARMDDVLPWFRGLPADQRSWVMLVAQAGVRSFVSGCGQPREHGPHELSDEIFDAAPRTLARSISLQQTVQLIKVTIDVVEEQVPRLAAPGEEQAVADAMLRFSREVAFSAARVYARAAESRGTWDARLQAQLVDALLRGDAPDELASRAAALGWDDAHAGRGGGRPLPRRGRAGRAAHRAPAGPAARRGRARRGARQPAGAGAGRRRRPARRDREAARPAFGDGPVVVGPAVPTLDEATESARAALAGFRAAPAWPAAPAPGGRRPTCCRSGRWPATPRPAGCCGRTCSGRWCGPAASCWRRWTRFFAAGGVLESAARALFVHPNTVRYRLRRVGEVTGLSPLHGP